MGLEKINVFKKEQGLTNEDLAKLSGVPKSTIDKITSGKTYDPKLETVKAIARALGKTINDFDDEITDPNYGKETENKEDDYLELIENSIVHELMDNIEGIRLDTGQPGKLKNKKEALEFFEFLLDLPQEADEEINTLMDYLKFKYKRQ